MELNVFNKLCFYDNEADFNSACFYPLTNYHWESDPPYRPATYFKMGVVGECLVATLKCYEENPRAVFTQRDDPVYNDSCLEFFVAPISGRDEYINVEMNSRATFLCEFGKGKYDRVFLKSFTDAEPAVEAFNGTDAQGAFWGVTATLTKEFLSAVYNISKSDIDFETVKANFYKCGDACDVQHYLAFSPVTTLPPGFHNPECFAIFKK